MSLRGSVRCIFVYMYFPHLLGRFLHILTCTYNYMLWPLAPREYNLSIPNTLDLQRCEKGPPSQNSSKVWKDDAAGVELDVAQRTP
jgi:hypothetical protein